MRAAALGILLCAALAGCRKGASLPTVHGLEVAVESANFESEVAQSTQPVLVEFGASWCGPCRKMAPVIEQLSRDYEGRVKFAKVDVDYSPDLASRYDVNGIPSLLLFRNGDEIGRTGGFMAAQGLSQWIDSQLQPEPMPGIVPSDALTEG